MIDYKIVEDECSKIIIDSLNELVRSNEKFFKEQVVFYANKNLVKLKFDSYTPINKIENTIFIFEYKNEFKVKLEQVISIPKMHIIETTFYQSINEMLIDKFSNFGILSQKEANNYFKPMGTK